MIYWIFLLICNMLIPLIMIIFGNIFANNFPKKINSIYGYRTTMSMKNEETWEFAHNLCGKIWKKTGIIMALPSLLLTLFSFQIIDDMQGVICLVLITIQTVALICSIFPVEKELKKNFDSNGHRL